MNSKPFVSVIVLNWNGKSCIHRCLESLSKQTYEKYEIIVVDNASSDESPEIVRRNFPRVKLIVNDQNLGFARGNNIGIEHATGDLIALFNYDAVADSNWLSELVSAILESEKNGIVGGPIYYFEPRDVIWAMGGKIDYLTGLGWHVCQDKTVNECLSEFSEDIDYIPGTALLIKRKVINEIGPLDEDYFLYNDDLDLCFRVKRVGYKCSLVKSAPVWHMVSFSWRGRPLIGYYHNMRSTFYFYLKNLPIPFLLTAIFFQYIIFTFFEIFIFRRPIRYMLVKTQALAWNLLNIKIILRKRKITRNLGKGVIKIRVRELLKIMRERVKTKQYHW
jgi:GT2 family glycosyltransferase